MIGRSVGHDAVLQFGWWHVHRYLLARRLLQFTVMGLFLLGPLAGVWILRGNLSSSRLLDVLPMTDTLTFLQTIAAGHQPQRELLIGAMVVISFYLLVGGRTFCSWVCPVNPITDLAAWLRRRLGLRPKVRVSRDARLLVLAAVLVAPLLTGVMVWEHFNPVAAMHRGLIFGMGMGWLLLLTVFLLDLALIKDGWCGHLCPIGACYAQLGRFSPLRVRASRREQCDRCMECFAVCPEAQVLAAPLFQASTETGPDVESIDCTRCLRCVEVCPQQVFDFVAVTRHKELTHEQTVA